MNLFSFRSGYFNERTKKMKVFFEKNENLYFWQKPEGVILHDGNFEGTKRSLHFAALCEGEWFSYLFSVFSSEKTQLEVGKNGNQFIIIFSLPYLFEKTETEKNFAVIFSLTRTLQKPRRINETINPIFGLGHEI